jgi:hypothetical protein
MGPGTHLAPYGVPSETTLATRVPSWGMRCAECRFSFVPMSRRVAAGVVVPRARVRWSLPFALLAAVLVALVAAAVVLGANPGKEKIALSAAGRVQAKAEVLHRADVGAGWSGGAKKPNLSSAMPCSGYRPKQSDLVLIGVAETKWQAPGVEIDSQAQVLQTAAMVGRDWRRTVLAPQVLPCVRQGLAKALGSTGKLVSFRRIAFPRVARYTRAFRAVFDVTTAIGSVPVEMDLLAFGAGRNELTLSLTGPATAKASLHRAEARLARLLAGRIRP